LTDHFEKLIFYILTALSSIFLIVYVYVLFSSKDLDHSLVNSLITGHVLTQGVLTIWMIRDCIRHPFANTITRINWLTAVVFFGVFGTTLYYLKVKRRSY